MEECLKVENLQTAFFTKHGELRAVDGVSFEIQKGRTLGIVGESGCGKSVTSFSIMGLIKSPGRVVGGKISFNGEDLLKYSEKQMQHVRGNKIAMIFQEPMSALNPVMRIGDQIIEQILAHENVSRSDAVIRAIVLLSLVGIPSPDDRIWNYPHQLSGGMRQRAMIAMALSCNPDLLIADEPTTALDVTIQSQILDLLIEIQEKNNMAIQFITHDLGVISDIADDVVVMYAGRVVEKGSVKEIFNNPKHPYTIGLMASIPRVDSTLNRLSVIEGNVPSLANLPSGCRFHDRCKYATDECKAAQPDLTQCAGSSHFYACFHPVEVNKCLP